MARRLGICEHELVNKQHATWTAHQMREVCGMGADGLFDSVLCHLVIKGVLAGRIAGILTSRVFDDCVAVRLSGGVHQDGLEEGMASAICKQPEACCVGLCCTEFLEGGLIPPTADAFIVVGHESAAILQCQKLGQALSSHHSLGVERVLLPSKQAFCCVTPSTGKRSVTDVSIFIPGDVRPNPEVTRAHHFDNLF